MFVGLVQPYNVLLQSFALHIVTPFPWSVFNPAVMVLPVTMAVEDNASVNAVVEDNASVLEDNASVLEDNASAPG